METLQLEEQIVKMLRTVYDPEIPVNIYDLGLIYNVDIQDEGAKVVITMTLTAPNCPAADFILQDVQIKVESIKGVGTLPRHSGRPRGARGRGALHHGQS